MKCPKCGEEMTFFAMQGTIIRYSGNMMFYERGGSYTCKNCDYGFSQSVFF